MKMQQIRSLKSKLPRSQKLHPANLKSMEVRRTQYSTRASSANTLVSDAVTDDTVKVEAPSTGDGKPAAGEGKDEDENRVSMSAHTRQNRRDNRDSRDNRAGRGRGGNRGGKQRYRENVRTNYETLPESSDPEEIRKQVCHY